MADITQLKRYGAPRINWGKWFLIGTGMLVSAFILLVPMIYIFVQAFSKGLMPVLQNLADPDMLHAIWLTVLIALIGGAATLWGPLIAAIVFSVLAETLRLQAPQIYMMSLGLLLILSVLYLPGGLASLRWATFGGWWRDSRGWLRGLKDKERNRG